MARTEHAVVTLADVAKLAGVSKATASKALADRYGVSPATRDRVLQVARDLNFTPNLLARGLGGGKTETIGMIATDFEGRFALQIMVGVEDALGADQSSVIMCNSRGRRELEEHHIRELLRRSVDGLIIVGDRLEPRPPISVTVPVPVVYAYAFSEDPQDTSIVCDNVEAGRLAARHLIDCGKTKLAYLGGTSQDLAAQDRGAGFSVGIAEAGLAPATGDLIYGEWSEEFGWNETARLLDSGVDLDGLVCGDDQIARGAMDQLFSRDRRVPSDIAVIGFDNWKVLSQVSRLPFSSVDMRLDMVGRAAVQALIEPGGPPPGMQRIAGEVAVRGSTART